MKRWIAVFAMLFCFAAPSPVLATTLTPDSVTIDSFHVNHYLLVSGDYLLTAVYNVNYAAIPTATINNAFSFELWDGATLKGSALAYPYHTKGYGKGMVSLYFPLATAPTWNTTYTFRIAGNPVEFATPPQYNFTVQTSDYTSLTSQANNQADLTTRVIQTAQTLTTAWSYSSTPLTSQGDTGTVLSSYGDDYFRNAINGLQGFAPSLFQVQLLNPDTTARSWSTTQATTYETRYSANWVGTALTAAASLIGIPSGMSSSIPTLVICFLLIIICVAKLGDAQPGLVATLGVVLCGSIMAMFPFVMLAIIEVLCALYIVYQLMLKGAN